MLRMEEGDTNQKYQISLFYKSLNLHLTIKKCKPTPFSCQMEFAFLPFSFPNGCVYLVERFCGMFPCEN